MVRQAGQSGLVAASLVKVSRVPAVKDSRVLARRGLVGRFLAVQAVEDSNVMARYGWKWFGSRGPAWVSVHVGAWHSWSRQSRYGEAGCVVDGRVESRQSWQEGSCRFSSGQSGCVVDR